MSALAPFINIGLVMVIMQIANRFDLDNPIYTNYIRAAYLTTQCIGFISMFYIKRKIAANQDKTPLKYTESKNFLDPTDVKTIETTVQEHDETKLNEQIQQAVMAICIMAFLHFKWNYIRPLLLQSILGLRNISSTQLFKIYILGTPAVGDLARPWKNKMFETPSAVETTPKEVKAAEKKAAKKKLNRLD